METLKPKKVRTLKQADKELFEKEIEEWESEILDKRYEIVKLNFQMENISDSLEWKLAEIKNRILAAEAERLDIQTDQINGITKSKIRQLEKKHAAAIARLESNIKVRKRLLAENALK